MKQSDYLTVAKCLRVAGESGISIENLALITSIFVGEFLRDKKFDTSKFLLEVSKGLTSCSATHDND